MTNARRNQHRQDSNHQSRNLIVGGHNIEQHRYPYFCSIDKNNGVIVNGALIAPDIVLSAGHIALNHMDNLTLKVGPYAVHEQEAFAETIPVESWVVPSNWSEFLPGYFQDDYLILKLKHRSTHRPVRINRNPWVPRHHQPVTMIGLGWLSASYLSPASIVQEVELLAVNNSVCSAIQDPSRNLTYSDKITDSMLCTMEPPNTVRDGCAWDSGAPVVLPGAKPKDDVLIALGSTGIGCADPVFPSIQAKVACDFGLWWIRHQVCQLSADPPADFRCVTTNPNATTTASLTMEEVVPRSSVHPQAAFIDVPMLLLGCLVVVAAFVLVMKARSDGTSSKRSTRAERAIFEDQAQPRQYGTLG